MEPWEADFELGARRKAVREKVRVPLKKALKTAAEVEYQLSHLATEMVLVGSLRRGRPEVADIEFVILPEDLEDFRTRMGVRGFTPGPKGRQYKKVLHGIPIEIYVAFDPMELGSMVQMYTGDYLFNIAMRSKAKRMGHKLDQYGIWKDGKIVFQSPLEEGIFDFVGMDWHEPEERSLAARQDLMGMVRDLRDAPLTKKETDIVEAAEHDLKEERYLEAAGEKALRKIHAKYGAKVGLGSIRDWIPGGERTPSYRKVSEELKVAETISQGEPFQQWRPPDETDEDLWIWYGPSGREGDVASTVEWVGGEFEVCEYQSVIGLLDDPPGPLLKQCAYISPELVVAAAKVTPGGGLWRPPSIEEVPRAFLGFAVDIGVKYLSYYGGEDTFVDALP